MTEVTANTYLDGEQIGSTAETAWRSFTRQAPLELAQEGDGRTLVGRVVPYNVVARVADPPDYTPYNEMFLPGAFRAQLQAANRIDVLLNYEHRQGISDVVGRGVALDDRPDGLYGTFRVLSHADGDKALELYHAGILTGLSVEGTVRNSPPVDGVVQRSNARIRNVALCRPFESSAPERAGYPGAEVLAVRTQDKPEPDIAAVKPYVPPLDLDRLAALGIQPVIFRAVVRRPWDGSPARFTDEEYQRSCLIDRGGTAPVKERCSLPVLEPNGDLNANALGPAAAALRGARGGLSDVSSEQKASAARKLMRYYRQAEMMPPPGIQMMAGMGGSQ